MKKFLIIAGIFLITNLAFAQQSGINKKIDSLIATKSENPFNGVVIVSENEKIKYSKYYGFSDQEKKTILKPDDQFVIGSISKQITAVLVLQEFDRGKIRLDIPIKNYLPELSQKWSDTITVHQLLTHTHGITEDLSPDLSFRPGTQFSYSQSGYDLLSKIVEKTSGVSFAELSERLFEKCKMKNTFHPSSAKHKNLSSAYVEMDNGTTTKVSESDIFNNAPVAAGGFISTANDLVLWNNCLHKSNLLSESTYDMMIHKQPYAVRQHPIFGLTQYGYGITVNDYDGISQLGLTGFAPGYVSLNFYLPKQKTSIIILENVVHDINNINKTFYYHVQVLKIIKENL